MVHFSWCFMLEAVAGLCWVEEEDEEDEDDNDKGVVFSFLDKI